MEGSIRPPTAAAGTTTPATVRRNPPRRARPPPTPLASAKPKLPSLSSSLDDEDEAEAAPPPPPPASSSSSRSLDEERLKVFLRIRPLPDRDRDRRKDVSRPMPAKDPRRKPKPPAPGGVCLVATGPNSVALTVPQSKLVDSKRGRTEVFDGFSAVFSPDSSQNDIFAEVMNPLVDDFLRGKSGLLVAMGPTGSGKTHTIFGSPRNPGILPLTLRQIFNAANETKVAKQPARSFSLSMFEILSEGKGEHILDLLSDASPCVLQQSTIKGLQEVAITKFLDAESLVSLGMMKRSTAATNANSKSSRSQCIITIRAVHKSIDVESEHLPSSSVLTIADLAGAERERRTGNQGLRMLESNFINNTSMVFGLCLRSLLEHQKNQKKPLEKHFKNSMLTRYLRDYLEGRKKMTLVLNVKPGDDDYLDTSFLLRQASPYMKIKYTSLEDSSDLVSQKRINVSLICQEKKKKRKVHNPEILVVEQKENVGTDDNVKVSERDEAQHKILNSELRRVSRSEEIMTKFAKALWTVLKQYKHKLLESENTAESMKELIKDKDIQIMELKREMEVLNSSCSCKNFPIVRDAPGVQDDTVSSGEAAVTSVPQSNQTDLSDAATDNFHFVVEAEEFTCHGPKIFPTYCELKGESASCNSLVISSIPEQEQSSRDFKAEKSYSPESPDASGPNCDLEPGNTKVGVQVVHKELDSSGNFAEETSSLSSTTPACSHSDNQSDQGLTGAAGHHTTPCQRTERVSQSPQFTRYNKKSATEQSEDESEELSMTAVHDICHDAITDVSSPQQVKSDTKHVSSIQSSLRLQGMKNAEEVETEFERCEPAPAVEDSMLTHGCGGRSERTCTAKASMVVKDSDSEASDVADPLVLRHGNTKKKTRRLQPAASMMLKEFGGSGMEDMDTKREDRSNESQSGRSDVLIELLKKCRNVRRP